MTLTAGQRAMLTVLERSPKPVPWTSLAPDMHIDDLRSLVIDAEFRRWIHSADRSEIPARYTITPVGLRALRGGQ